MRMKIKHYLCRLECFAHLLKYDGKHKYQPRQQKLTIMDSIYHAVGAKMPCAADFARHQIAALFYHPAMQTLTTGGNKIMRSPLVEQFMNLLREHYITETAVAFYSERLHISEAHLSRIVKQETEMTVLQWINSFRIKHAKQLLRYTRMNMSEIAFDLHFTSAEYFRYFFRRETGISPIVYRQQSTN